MRSATSFISVKPRSNCLLVCFCFFLFSFAGPDTLSTAMLMARNNSERLDLVMAHDGLMTAKVLFYYAHLPECCSRYSDKQQKPHLRFVCTLQFCKHAATPHWGEPLVVPGYDDVYLIGIWTHVSDGAGKQPQRLMFSSRHVLSHSYKGFFSPVPLRLDVQSAVAETILHLLTTALLKTYNWKL